jgi:alcohol dehydrogenase class IV
LLRNPGDILDYLEVVGRAQPLTAPSAPYLAVPTTAGTGSEVTRNAVLASPEHRVKVSLRSPWMLPAVALVDPELTYALPPDLTATTGLDALTQLIEPFVCARANPMTDAICREGMAKAAPALRRVHACPEDAAARADMCLASLFGGMALANAGLGAVHGFAGPLGGMYPAPHGAVCAALLPHVMAANCAALQRRGRTETLARYDEVARCLTGHPAARAADGIAWTRALVRELGIPALAAYGIRVEDSSEIVARAAQASSMKANPVPLELDELKDVLAAAIAGV